MKKLKFLSVTLTSLMLLQACNDDDDKTPPTPEPMLTIVETAAAAGSFNTLVAALEATGLDSTLSVSGAASKSLIASSPSKAKASSVGAKTV